MDVPGRPLTAAHLHHPHHRKATTTVTEAGTAMTSLFQPAEPDTYDAEPTTDACACLNPDDQYLLEIDNGSVFLIHRACGKQPAGDYTDLVEMGPLPVTLTAQPYGNCDGREWHGEHRCDCGIALVATLNPRAVPGGRLPFTRNRRTRARRSA